MEPLTSLHHRNLLPFELLIVCTHLLPYLPLSLRQLFPTRSCGKLTPCFLTYDYFFLTSPKCNHFVNSRYSLKTMTRYSLLRHGTWQDGLPVYCCWCGTEVLMSHQISQTDGSCDSCGLTLWASFHQSLLGHLLDEALPLSFPARKLYSRNHMLRAYFAGFLINTFLFLNVFIHPINPGKLLIPLSLELRLFFVILTLLYCNTERPCLTCHPTLFDDDEGILSE